jgi:hypothetical protein
MVIKPEENNDITNMTTTLLLWNFRTSYSMEKTNKSVFSLPGGWEFESGEPSLLPKELSFAYNQRTANMELIRNRLFLSFNVNTSLNFDLQRHTNSNFQFSMGFMVNVPGLLVLNFSASSRNSVIFRYFKNVPGMEELTYMYPDGEQNNVFKDLFDSFNFGDESKRRRSGFKIQRFNFSAVHFLGDWQAEFGISMFPYQDTSLPHQRYKIAADISFLVQWRPITEIKSDVGYDGRHNRWTMR